MTIGTKVNVLLTPAGEDPVERIAILDLVNRDRVLLSFDDEDAPVVQLPFIDLMDALNVLHERKR